MKPLFLLFAFLCLPFLQYGQYDKSTLPTDTIRLHGYRPIQTASALVLNVTEVNGVLVLALAQNVQLYLQDKIIATIPYSKLTGGGQSDRSENVLLVPDIANSRVFVIDDVGVGIINCTNQSYSKLGVFKPRVKEGVELLDAQFSNNSLTIYFPVDPPIIDASSLDKNLNIDLHIERKDSIQLENLQVRPINNTGTGERILLKKERDTIFQTPFWDIVKIDRASSSDTLEYLAVTKNDGLYRIRVDKPGNLIDTTYIEIKLSDGTILKKLRSITYLKDSHAILIGTIGQHAYLISLAQNEVFTPFIDPTKQEKHNHFWSSCKVNDTLYLAGNDTGEVFLLDARDNTLKHTQKLGNFMVRSLAKIKEHTFWAGTNTGKIIELTLKTAKNITAKKLFDDIRLRGTIYDLHLQNDSIFMATSKGLGTIANHFNASKDASFLDNMEGVNFISPYHNNTFFYGGEEGLKFWKDKGNSISLPAPLNDAHISYALPFKKKQKDYLLISTRETFFFIVEWDKEQKEIVGKLQHFNANQGLSYFATDGTSADMMTIYSGVAFENTIWLSSNFGLMEYDIKKERLYFYQHTGAALEHNTGAFHQQTDSTAFFGTLNGTVKVDIKQAIKERQLVDSHLKPQIWEIKNKANLDAPTFRNTLIYEKLKPDSTYEIAFEEKDRRFWVLAPNYSLLQRNEFTLVRSDGDTLKVFDDQVLKSEELIAKFSSIFGENKKVVLFSEAYKFHVNRNLNFLLVSAAIIVSLIAIILSIILNKYIQARKKYNLRRELFVQLQDKLSKVKGYPDIQKAFLTITKKEMKETLQATKITLYKHERGSKELRILGHNEYNLSAWKEELQSDNVQQKTLSLTTDQNYPAVYFWNRLTSEEEISSDLIRERRTEAKPITFYRLLANNAIQDFYGKYDLDRQTPIIGENSTESFIFLLIGTPQQPYGLITIQNEAANMFSKESKEKEYLDLLSTLGGMLEYKLKEIESESQLRLLQVKTSLFKKKIGTHFLANLLMFPIIKIKSFVNYTDFTKGVGFSLNASNMLRTMFSLKDTINIKEELEAGKKYIDFYVQTLLQSGKEVSYTIDLLYNGDKDYFKNQRIPSLLITNFLHNSIYHNVGHVKYIKISVLCKMKNENLIIEIQDNGIGFPLNINHQPEREKHSLDLIQDYFKSINQVSENKIKLQTGNIIENEQIEGALVTMQIPKNIF